MVIILEIKSVLKLLKFNSLYIVRIFPNSDRVFINDENINKIFNSEFFCNKEMSFNKFLKKL